LGPGFPKELEPVKQHILAASKASGVDANLITAVIMNEAKGRFQDGINGTLQYGLMQVDPNTYKLELQPKYHLSGDNINDPQINIMAGAFHLKENIAQFGSIPVALRAYNSGPNGVDRNNLSALPSGTGTANYVDSVMQNYNLVKGGG